MFRFSQSFLPGIELRSFFFPLVLIRGFVFFAIGFFFLALLNVPATAQTRPDEFVGRMSNEILDKVRQQRQELLNNPQKLSEFVSQVVMPHVDFERMTALAVGRTWRSATPEQQQRISLEFRNLLTRTYAGALQALRDQKIRLKPFRGDAAEAEVVVRSEIVGSRGDPIGLDYRLYRQGESWKIYDINIAGVWLVETYRNQFASEINARGLDGLIATLADRNRSLEARKL
ncbi:MAG: ABC transporter substrate-binding protein [Betaproteobacteria bacterium]|nr:ABC transporter substrate-binding protein [Betaproteobacteria bacterium]